MPSLRASLQDLADSFAEAVMNAIRGASLDELVGDRARAGRGISGGTTAGNPKARLDKTAIPGRLPRRSVEEIQASLQKVVLLVKTRKDGMRAEEIRATLGMHPKEMPRILKEGVAKKRLTTKGQKRATTYFAK